MNKTTHKISWAFWLTVFLCLGFFSVQASEVLSTSDVSEKGSWAVSVLGREAEIKPLVRVSGGASALFSDENADIKLEQNLSEIVAAMEYHPSEGLTYRLRLGQIRDFDLQFSSGSQTNKLESIRDGFIWGLGMRGGIAPGSIVSAAISWEFQYTQRTVSLERLQGGETVFTVDDRVRQDEYQAGVNFSRRWKSIEPYAGLKLMRTVTRLQDNTTKQRVGGRMDGFSPYAGLQWAIAEHESAMIEGSLADEKSLTAGLKIQF